jgi:homoserine dehydrogenase
MSEVTIGSSIPVKTTLNDLLCGGDAINSIRGVMSVSVNNVMSLMCDRGMSFSESVQRTYEAGLFEKDPFDDLTGLEASQKVMLLAREMGIPMHIHSVATQAVANRRSIADWSKVGASGEFSEEDKYVFCSIVLPSFIPSFLPSFFSCL